MISLLKKHGLWLLSSAAICTLKPAFYLIALALAVWLLLKIDNPLADWVSERYQAKVSDRLEREMRWNQ